MRILVGSSVARTTNVRFGGSSCIFGLLEAELWTPIPIWYVAVFLPMLQTGSFAFGINLTSGSFEKCLKYALPILAFAIGIALSYAIRAIAREHLHWGNWRLS